MANGAIARGVGHRFWTFLDEHGDHQHLAAQCRDVSDVVDGDLTIPQKRTSFVEHPGAWREKEAKAFAGCAAHDFG